MRDQEREGTRFTPETHVDLHVTNEGLKESWAVIAARKSREEASMLAESADIASENAGHARAAIEVIKSPEQVLIEGCLKDGTKVLIMRSEEALSRAA